MKKHFLIVLCLFPFYSIAHVDASKNKAALLQVQEKIKSLEQTLYDQKREEQNLVTHLASLEKEMGQQSEKLRTFEKKKQTHEITLKDLEQKRIKLEQVHQKQLVALEALVRSEFQHQRKEGLQLLFEQSEWANVARLNEYFRYFYDARTTQLNEIKQSLTQLQTLQQALMKEQEAIESLSQQIKTKQAMLQEKYTQRHQVLTSLKTQRSDVNTKLSQFQKQETHLNQLFKSLKETLTVTPQYVEPMQKFSVMKKKLSLPIHSPQATLSLIPGAKKNNAKKTYIEASEGTPVNAIFPGKVVFAEWLRGIGLLIIVDHGNGYMSLYGNNQTLYKSLGDTVNQGEMIARVGQSGGQAKAGLYFEIRKDGETLDPTHWFKKT